MKRSLTILMLLPVLAFGASQSVFGQGQCSFTVSMVNHNRYAYDTAEECLNCPSPPCHSFPNGNWGVSSNVGSKRDADQFKGWTEASNCSELKVQWNSCSREFAKPNFGCGNLNFPDWAGAYPYPANGYPFTDSYGHNNNVPSVGGTDRCVDQYSPCGHNVYGTATASFGVSAVQDWDGDGIMDGGGCMDLNGYYIGVQQNFMTVYELDWPDSDDVINSLYYPNVWATLSCTPEGCVAVNDTNFDGWIDDIGNQFSSEYVQPTLYQDNHDRVSYATDPGVLAKRIDATIRIGRVSAYYSGPYPTSCDPWQEQHCYNRGGTWDSFNCMCSCEQYPYMQQCYWYEEEEEE